jgi:hypothetical protein
MLRPQILAKLQVRPRLLQILNAFLDRSLGLSGEIATELSSNGARPDAVARFIGYLPCPWTQVRAPSPSVSDGRLLTLQSSPPIPNVHRASPERRSSAWYAVNSPPGRTYELVPEAQLVAAS